MLRRTPAEASETTRLEPPYETNGSVIPVNGARPSTAARLMSACPQTSAVMPAARSFPNGSLQRIAIRNPASARTANAQITSVTPMRPSSSPMTAKIMSVCASGRYEIFPTPSPSPAPVTPPEPIQMVACTIWKPAPCASDHGSRKLNTRARRYGSM